MKTFLVTIGLWLSLVLAPALAAAHPDHLDGGDHGLAHLIGDPFHLALTALAVGLAVGAARVLGRRPALRRRRR